MEMDEKWNAEFFKLLYIANPWAAGGNESVIWGLGHGICNFDPQKHNK